MNHQSARLEFFKRIPVFHLIRDEDIHMLMALIQERTLIQGDVIIEENQPSDGLSILRDGHVRVQRKCLAHNEWIPLVDLGPGNLIGEFSLIKEIPATATVTCLTDVCIWWMSRIDFQVLIQRETPMAARVLRLLAENLVDKLVRTTQIMQQLHDINRCLCLDDTFRDFYRNWNYET